MKNMKNSILATTVVLAVVLVSFAGCGSGGNGSIEGTWVNSGAATEITFTDNEFVIVHHTTDWSCKGTYSVNDDELTWVIAEIEVFDWENEIFAEDYVAGLDASEIFEHLIGSEEILPFSFDGKTITFTYETGAEEIFTRKR